MTIRTTAVGSWPIPFGQRLKLKAYYAGAYTDEQAEPFLSDAARIAMDEQIACGLHQIMGGEVFAPDFLHHIPPRLHGLQTLQPRDTTRGQQGVGRYRVVDTITAPIGTGHAKAWRRESRIEPTLDKASVPSPLTIAGSFDAPDNSTHLNDVVHIVQNEIADMAANGLHEIQLDAPAEAVAIVAQRNTADDLIPHIEAALQPARNLRRTIHFCLGDIARKPSIETQNLHALLPLIQRLDGAVDRVHIECSYAGQWDEHHLLADMPPSIEIIAGIADVKSKPASVSQLKRKIDSLLHILPPDRLLLSTSCGCGRVPHDQAIRLNRNLVKAAETTTR